MKNFAVALVSTLFLAVAADAATITAYKSVNGLDVAANEVGHGVTGINLQRDSGLKAVTNPTQYTVKHWSLGTTKAGAVAANDTLFWGFTSTAMYDLDRLTFGYKRNDKGPTSIALDLYINGVFAQEIFSDLNFGTNNKTASIDLSAFGDVTNATFRLSGWGAAKNGGRLIIKNRNSMGGNAIVVSGDLTPIPLPASLPMFALGFGMLAAGQRLRKPSKS